LTLKVELIEKNKLRWVYVLSALFIALNAYLVVKEHYWGFLLPVVLALLLLYVYSLDKVLLIITFLTPLAINVRDFEYNLGISLPTEPLLFGVLLFFLFRVLYENDFDKRASRHPVSLAIYIYLAWMLITTFTSELPWVSVKFFVARLWFVIPFFFIATQLFKNPANVKRFIWLYTIPLSGVVIYTLYKHSLWGFAEDPGHWVMSPFFNDHTAYGAVLAMYIPVLFGMMFSKHYTRTLHLFCFLFFVILGVGIFFSFSRAAWLSLAFGAAILIIILLKIRFRTLALVFLGVVVVFSVFQDQIFQRLEKNKQDSSSNLVEHVQSIANITTDASNLERINRWKSAIRMFSERPVLGWGPGTYQFLYAPFQNSQERTIISTNAGDRGNAHSEYIGPLSESGFPGMLSFIAVVVLIIYTGLKVWQRAADKDIRLMSLLIVLGLFTYLVHGFLNNFLDSDKASVPFWGFAAVLVSFDLYAARREIPARKTSSPGK